MKTFIALSLSLFFFISLFIFAYFFPFNASSVSALQQNSIDSNSLITNKLLLDYYSEHREISSQAKSQITEITLNNLNFSHWNEFIESIELQIYKEKVLPSSLNQLIVVLNLSKDLAIIAIFNEMENHYIFYSEIENLVPVKDIYFFSYPNKDYKYMVVKQVLDEKLGAFTFEEFLEIYFSLNDSFKKVWRKSLYSEEIYKEIWVNQNANDDVWNKIVEKTLVDISSNETITINTFSTLSKYIAVTDSFPKDIDFKLESFSTASESYKWNSQQKSFIYKE
ncbi:MAG: hypothetical protein ACLKAK_05265 [Alkaliphilus sp.]